VAADRSVRTRSFGSSLKILYRIGRSAYGYRARSELLVGRRVPETNPEYHAAAPAPDDLAAEQPDAGAETSGPAAS